MILVIPISLCLYAGYLYINQGTHSHAGGWNWDPPLLFHLMLQMIEEFKETPRDLEINIRMYGVPH
jgi:hypothetical protein